MRFYSCLALTFVLLATSTLQGAPSLLNQENPREIAINNRILATVNGEPISAIDITRKLDRIFDRQFPEYSQILEARYQFYQVNWQSFLNELIEKQLILEEAKMAKVEIADGEIHREIERRFGPTTLANLDKAGLTYDEAKEQIREEMTIQRMVQMQVHSKAIRQVTPQLIQEAYETHAAQNQIPHRWEYHVLSFRGNGNKMEAAHHLHALLNTGALTLEKLSLTIDSLLTAWPDVSARLSEKYDHTEQQIAPDYKEALTPLHSGEFSEPVAQKSRSGDVVRIFFLTNFTPGGAVPFKEVEKELESQLLEKIVGREMTAYINRLRRQFPVDDRTEESNRPLFEIQ